MEERKGVCLCGCVGSEKDISELDSHCGVCSVIRVTTICGEAFSCASMCVCVGSVSPPGHIQVYVCT